MKTSSSDAGTGRAVSTPMPCALQRGGHGRHASRLRAVGDAHVRALAERLDVFDAGKRRQQLERRPRRVGDDLEQSPGEAGLEGGRAIDGEHAPLVQQRDARAPLRLVEVRRRHHDGEPVAEELRQQLPELAPRDRIDAGRRLVEQQHLRLVDERAGERQLLLHAARQAIGAGATGTA